MQGKIALIVEDSYQKLCIHMSIPDLRKTFWFPDSLFLLSTTAMISQNYQNNYHRHAYNYIQN